LLCFNPTPVLGLELFVQKMSSDCTTLRKLPIKVLKARAATHMITAPAGDPGEKATWIAAIQQAEGSGGGGGGWKPDVGAEWEVLDGRMSVGRRRHTASVHGDVICAVGGHDSPATVEVYDTATKVWTELAGGGMTLERMDSASAVHEGKLYVVGGHHPAEDDNLRSVEVYDFATQQWSLLPTEMATARGFHGAVVYEDKLYVVGGLVADAEGTTLASVEVYNFATETWSILPAPMPQARCSIYNKVVQHKGKLYVVGGISERGAWLQSVAVYDIAAEEWSVLPAEMRMAWVSCAAAVHGNKIYVLGGGDEGWTPLRNVEVYDIAAGVWSMMSVEMTVARNSVVAAVHGNNLYAVGGGRWDNDEACLTMEVLALPSPLPWTPTRHSTFPNSFKQTVYTLVHCFARTNTLPDDVLFKIIWLLLRSAFKTGSK
jgi:N-acetylneuraminic acid mutarotase